MTHEISLKSKLVQVLINFQKINSDLDSEIKRFSDKKRFGKCGLKDLTISSDGWRQLEENNQEQLFVLREINSTYRELYDLNPCGCNIPVEETACSSTVTQYDYKKYGDLKDSLLNLLETSRNLYKSLKDKLEKFKVLLRFNESKDEAVNDMEAIEPEFIEKIIQEIANELKTILHNCKELWGVKELVRDSFPKRDSGYKSGSRASQEAGILESLEILSVTRNDSNLITQMGRTAAQRRPSAVEHDEINEETSVKEV